MKYDNKISMIIHFEVVENGSAVGRAVDDQLKVEFGFRLKMESHSSRLTSDAKLLAFREFDEALGLIEMAGQALAECGQGETTTTRCSLSSGRRCSGDWPDAKT